MQRLSGFKLLAIILSTALATLPCDATELKPAAAKAFDEYISAAEKRLWQEVSGGGNFLAVDLLPAEDRVKAYAHLKQGQVLIYNQRSLQGASVPEGLIHDWTGIVFVPGSGLGETLAVLQDYDRDEEYYSPDVVQSKLLWRSGDEFRVLLQLKRTYVVTAVFNTEYDVRYFQLNPAHAYSVSHSTRIAEVENPGESQEHEKPVGEDRGLLWRLNSYWRFSEGDGGTYVQCEAISLTRNVPVGLGWMVKPFIERVPVESLHFTLAAARNAVIRHKH